MAKPVPEGSLTRVASSQREMDVQSNKSPAIGAGGLLTGLPKTNLNGRKMTDLGKSTSVISGRSLAGYHAEGEMNSTVMGASGKGGGPLSKDQNDDDNYDDEWL